MSADSEFPMKVGIVASHIAEASGLASDLVARRIRGLTQQGILEPVDHIGRGDNAAALFDEREACAASIFIFLSEINYDARSLKKIREILRKPYVRELPTNEVRWTGQLGAAMSGIKHGEDWLLLLEFRVGKSHLPVQIDGYCHKKDYEPTEDERRIIRAARYAKGEEIAGAETRIKLNPLLIPFLTPIPNPESE